MRHVVDVPLVSAWSSTISIETPAGRYADQVTRAIQLDFNAARRISRTSAVKLAMSHSQTSIATYQAAGALRNLIICLFVLTLSAQHFGIYLS